MGRCLGVGRSYLRSGDLAESAEQFRLGVAMRPQDFRLNFDQGLCAYQMGRYDEAAAAFRVCVSLSPDAGACYLNRAHALAHAGPPTRGAIHYNLALVDLTRRDTGRPPAS